MSNHERYQQQLDEHDTDSKTPPRRTLSSHRKSDSLASRIPKPTPKNGEKSRYTFPNTRTLTGAFEATARRPSPSDSPKRNARRYTSEERQQRQSTASPASRASTPRRDSLETYRRNNYAENSLEHTHPNGFERELERERLRQLSPSPGVREDDMRRRNYERDSHIFGATNLDDVSDPELRKRLQQREMDDRRLQRVRGSEQPVFSRAKMGSKAVVSPENLHRRIERTRNEEQVKVETEVVDQGTNLPLSIPRDWGTRSRMTNDWLNRENQPSRDDFMADEEEPELFHDWENDVMDFTARSLQMSDSPPVRKTHTREEFHEPESVHLPSFTREDMDDSPSKIRGPERSADYQTNKPPITAHRSLEKPRIMNKEDTQDFLRRLARKESPSVINTPEAKITVKTPLNPKTPVVTGAWVDTPALKQATEPSEEVVQRTFSPPPKEVKQEVKPRTDPDPLKEAQAPSTETKEPPNESLPEEARRKRAPSIKLEKPNLPKSALASVIEDARSGKGGLDYGEDTIESLRELLEDSTTSSSDTQQAKKPKAEDTDTSKKAITERESEEILIDRLNAKLQSLVKNINEAKSGLLSLEDKATKEAASLTARRPLDSKQHVDHVHTDGLCAACGLHDDGLRYVAIPLPRLWRRNPDTGRIQFTRLSWALIFLVTWQIMEFAIDTYRYDPRFLNRPRYMASHNPEWPIAIPHTIWRWLHLSAIWIPIRDGLFACVRFVGVSLGLWDPFYDDWMYGDEWYGPNWIQMYNPQVYPEFYRTRPLAQEPFRPRRWQPVGTPFAAPVAPAPPVVAAAGAGIMGGGDGGGMAAGVDPDLSMNADVIL